jgi:hypothetical protein
MIYGTVGAVVQASANFGGGLVVFEGKPELLIGGFDFNMDDLPAVGDVLPCGTPVYCNEAAEARSITPIITAEVVAVDGSTVTLKDNGFGNVAFKVGATVGELPADLTSAATYYATVSKKEGNKLTLSGAITGLTVGDILVEVAADSKKVKAIPNALLPYDIRRGENEISRTGDGMYKNDRPILERRMPAINDAIKTALKNAGCDFKFSNRK